MINSHVTTPLKDYQITIYVVVVSMARDVMVLMRATSITRAIGRVGRALKIETFLDPDMATSENSRKKKNN
jgi:hypothetical protein